MHVHVFLLWSYPKTDYGCIAKAHLCRIFFQIRICPVSSIKARTFDLWDMTNLYFSMTHYLQFQSVFITGIYSHNEQPFCEDLLFASLFSVARLGGFHPLDESCNWRNEGFVIDANQQRSNMRLPPSLVVCARACSNSARVVLLALSDLTEFLFGIFKISSKNYHETKIIKRRPDLFAIRIASKRKLRGFSHSN